MQELSPAEAQHMLEASEVVAIDVREASETHTGVISGARPAPLSSLDSALPSLLLSIGSATPLFYCSAGSRSLVAAHMAERAGYSQAFSLQGGLEAWLRSGYSLHGADVDSRYARQIVLEGVGAEGQRRLGQASVAVVGVGGTGSSAGFYLAAAGVGRLRLIDADVVERSNLNRQVLHDDASIGMSKVLSAASTIASFNPNVVVESIDVRLDNDTAAELLGGVDLVVDCTDNAASRSAINASCVASGTSAVHGSGVEFEGTVQVCAKGTACVACLYPHESGGTDIGGCEVRGVLGAVPGAIGSVQAIEAIKLLLGIGTGNAGTLIVWDFLEQRQRRFTLDRNPQCAVCGTGLQTTPSG